MKNINLISSTKIKTFSILCAVISLFGMIVSILVNFPFAQYFSSMVQVLAHILTSVFAAVFKLTVVILMVISKEKELKALKNKMLGVSNVFI